MRYIILTIGLFAFAANASELTHSFKNPAFSGNGYSNHVLAIDQLQTTRKKELKEKQEAERKRVEAQGIADYQRIISTGLNDKQLQYEQIQMMKGLITSPNSKVIVMGKGNTPVILDSKDK